MNKKTISILLAVFLTGTVLNAADKEPAGRVFIINAITHDLKEFNALVQQAAVLKPYGKVRFQVSDVADKNFYAIPKADGNAWYEYAAYMSSISKFYPDKKLAPFIPAEFVKKNQELLLAKARILRENGMEAAFYTHEPSYLPDAFFEAYPEMRGPRVDHPRRSLLPAFSVCFDVPEVREMYGSMMTELLKNVPEIESFEFAANDAGSGICWADELYMGPNGPAHCRNISTGTRVTGIMEVFRNSAQKAGVPLDIFLSGGASMFSDKEKEDIFSKLPENCYYDGFKTPGLAGIGSFLNESYPVTGILNAKALTRQLAVLKDKTVHTFFINFGAMYSNGNERLDVTKVMLDMIAQRLLDPEKSDNDLLRSYCKQWGKDKSDVLFDAFEKLEEAVRYKRKAFPYMATTYLNVSMRYINRPLVIAPQQLAAKEESYFLPFVFNIYRDDARMDYSDVHGAHFTMSRDSVQLFIAKMNRVCALLDSASTSKSFIREMSASLKMYTSLIRSWGNFMEAQLIRDRNAEKLKAPSRPLKEPDFTGDPEFVQFNNVMRDELDNTQELIRLLEKHGTRRVIFTSDARYEDPFLLGPDLLNQLKKKRKVMLEHWPDAQRYFRSPLI